MKKCEQNNYSQRNRDIYIYYSLLMESKGEMSKWMPRNVIYEEVGEMFYLKKNVVGQILSKITKSGYVPSRPEVLEFLELRKISTDVISCEGSQRYLNKITNGL